MDNATQESSSATQPRHFGPYRKAPGIINSKSVYHMRKEDDPLCYPLSHRAKSLFLKYRNKGVSYDVYERLVRDQPDLTLSEALGLVKCINWDEVNEVSCRLTSFNRRLISMNMSSGVKYGNNQDYIFDHGIYPDIDSVWEKYSQLHMKSHSHHTDYWNEKPETVMDYSSTIELLCDHFVSALRLTMDENKAFLMGLSWIYTIQDDFIVVNEKFKKLCPHSVFLFVSDVAHRGISTKTTAAGFIHAKSVQFRGTQECPRFYSAKERDDMMLAINSEQQKASYSKLLRKQDSAFSNMYYEVRQHIQGVNAMLSTYRLKQNHDSDKVNGFMIAAQALKFYKFQQVLPNVTVLDNSPLHKANALHEDYIKDMLCESTKFMCCDSCVLAKYWIGAYCNDRNYSVCVDNCIHSYHCVCKVKERLRQTINYERATLINPGNFHRSRRRSPEASAWRESKVCGMESNWFITYHSIYEFMVMIRHFCQYASEKVFPYGCLLDDCQCPPDRKIYCKESARLLVEAGCAFEDLTDILPFLVELSKADGKNPTKGKFLYAQELFANIIFFFNKRPGLMSRYIYLTRSSEYALGCSVSNLYNDYYLDTENCDHMANNIHTTSDGFSLMISDKVKLTERRELLKEWYPEICEHVIRADTDLIDDCCSHCDAVRFFHYSKGIYFFKNDVLAENVVDNKHYRHCSKDCISSVQDTINKHLDEDEISTLHECQLLLERYCLESMLIHRDTVLQYELPIANFDCPWMQAGTNVNMRSVYDSANSVGSLANDLRRKLTGIDGNKFSALQDQVSMIADTIQDAIPQLQQDMQLITREHFKTGHAVKKAASSIEDLAKSVDMNTITASITSLSSSIVDINGVIKSTFDKINVFIPDFTKSFGFTLDSIADLKFGDVSACVILWVLYQNSTGDIAKMWLIALLYKLGILHQIMKGIMYVWSLLYKSDDESEDIKNTADDNIETTSLLDPLMWFMEKLTSYKPTTYAIIAMVIIAGFCGAAKYTQMKSVSIFHKEAVETCKELGVLGRGMHGLGTMFTYIIGGVTCALSFINKKIFGKEITNADEAMLSQFQALLINVRYYSTLDGIRAIQNDPKVRKFCATLYPQAVVFETHLAQGKLPKSMSHMVTQCTAAALKISNQCSIMEQVKTNRLNPYHISFFGPTGFGKSVLQDAVARYFHETYHKTIDINTYTFALGNQHGKEDWDGYKTTMKAVIIDDIDAISVPEQVALMIQLKSNTPFIIPQAELHDKGRYFSSEFMISSTNTPYPVVPGINCMDAYYARRDALIRVTPNPEYKLAFHPKTNRFSASLFSQYYPDKDSKEFPHLLFSFMDPMRNGEFHIIDGNQHKDLTYPEFMQIVGLQSSKHRISDPFFKHDETLLKTERDAFIATFHHLNQWFEDYGYESKYFDSMKLVCTSPIVNYDTLGSSYYFGPDVSMINDIHFTARDDTSEVIVNQLRRDFTPRAPLLPQNNRSFFEVNTGLVQRIDELLENTTMLQIPTREYTTSPDFKDLNIPVKYYRYFESYTTLAKHPENKIDLALTQMHGVILLKIKKGEESIIRDPTMRLCLLNLTTCPTRMRVEFITKELKSYHESLEYGARMKAVVANIRSEVKNVFSGIADIGKRFFNWITENWKINLVLLVGFGATVFMLTRLAKLFLPSSTAAYASPVQARHLPNISPTASQVVPLNIQDEADKVGRNVICVYDPYLGMKFHGVGLKGTLVMVPYHAVANYFVSDINKDIVWEIGMYPNYAICKRNVFSVNNIYRIGNSDCCIVKLPSINAFPDITSKCMKREARVPKIGTDVAMYYLSNNGMSIHQVVSPINAYENDFRFKTQDGLTFHETRSLQIRRTTRIGVSGAPVCTLDPTLSYRFIGIQSACGNGISYISCPFYEDICKAEGYLGGTLTHAGPSTTVSQDGSRFEHKLETTVDVIGSVPPNEVVGMNISSAYGLSPIAGDFYTSKNQPAILDWRDVRANGKWPLAKSVAKRTINRDPYLDPKILSLAGDCVSDHISNICRRRKHIALDYYTAVTGRRGVQGYTALNLKTSAGLPYILKPLGPGKTGLLRYDIEGNIDYFNSDLFNDVLKFDESINKGHIPKNSFYDFPKDEIVSPAKIIEVKTRSITNPNVVQTILYRKYCLDIEASLHVLGATGSYFTAVGIDPNSLSWHTLYYRLRSKNSHGFAFDIKNWDGSLVWQLWKEVLKCFNKVYKDEYSLARECLFFNAVFGYIQAADLIYRNIRGMPSGFAGTTTVNTVAHFILLFYIYLKICRDTGHDEYATFQHFILFVVVVLYGDDLTFTVSQTIVSWFNGASVAKAYMDLGWNITLADSKEKIDLESPVLRKGLPVEQLTFLKRQFHFDSNLGIMLAPLEIQSIMDLTYFLRETHEEPVTQFYQNLQTSLELMFHHGRQKYEDLLDNINRSLRSRKLQIISLPYPLYARLYLARYWS